MDGADESALHWTIKAYRTTSSCLVFSPGASDLSHGARHGSAHFPERKLPLSVATDTRGAPGHSSQGPSARHVPATARPECIIV